MKLQYLGDSKDSFKWDYHDFLTSSLKHSLLNIALMMTPDDGSNEGKSHPSRFPAREEIIDFCHRLRSTRSIEFIRELPVKTRGSYKVEFHNSNTYFENRYEYFTKLNSVEKQVLLLDPDNGFEPEKSLSEKHVSYQDIFNILQQIPTESVVSVFQHHRRILFPNDYARIKERIDFGFSTAIYWHSLMFVLISKSESILTRVVNLNRKFARRYPVNVIA